MSLCHLSVSGGIVSVHGLHDGVDPSLRSAFKHTQSDLVGDGEKETLYSLGNEPSLRLMGAAADNSIVSRRRVTSRVQVMSNGTFLQVLFRGKKPVVSFQTDNFTTSWMKLDSPAAESVVEKVGNKTVWETVRTAIYMPSVIGGNGAGAQQYVDKGHHANLVLRRLCEFAVEHALCPFGSRLRPIEPRACYFWLHQLTTGRVSPYAIQHASEVAAQAGGGQTSAIQSSRTQSIYVASAAQLMGCALIVSVCRAGSPVYGQRCELMDGDSGEIDILLLGESELSAPFPAVQADDYEQAIHEAFFILFEYNNVPRSRAQAYIALILNNLLLFDTTAARELRDDLLCPEISAPNAPLGLRPLVPQVDIVIDQETAPFNDPNLGLMPPSLRRNYFSNTCRDEVMIVPMNAAAIGDYTTVVATPIVAEYLIRGSIIPLVRPGVVNAYPAGYTVYSSTVLEAWGLPNVVALGTRVDWDAHWLGMSGRALYTVYIQQAPLVAGAVLPPGVQAAVLVGGALFNRLTAIVALPAGFSWHRVVDPYYPQGGTVVVVDYIHMATDAVTPQSWSPLTDGPTNFDLYAGNLNFVTGAATQEPWVRRNARDLFNFSRAHSDNPNFSVINNAITDYDGNPIQTQFAKFGAWLQAVGQAYWMTVRGNRLRFYAENYRLLVGLPPMRDYAIPDEYLITLGGQHAIASIESESGLWIYYYLKKAVTLKHSQSASFVRELFCSNLLADCLVVTRASVEAAQFVLKISDKRFIGNPTSWQVGLPNNFINFLMSKGRSKLVQYEPNTIGATALTVRSVIYGDTIGAQMLSLSLNFASSLFHDRPRLQAQPVRSVFYRLWVVPTLVSNIGLAMARFVSRPTYCPNFGVLEWFYTSEYSLGGISSTCGADFPFTPYFEDARVDALFYLLECTVGHHFAIHEYGIAGGPLNLSVTVPFDLIVDAANDIPLLEYRMGFPWTPTVQSFETAVVPPARAQRRLNNINAWGAAGLVVVDHATDVLPPIMRNRFRSVSVNILGVGNFTRYCAPRKWTYARAPVLKGMVLTGAAQKMLALLETPESQESLSKVATSRKEAEMGQTQPDVAQGLLDRLAKQIAEQSAIVAVSDRRADAVANTAGGIVTENVPTPDRLAVARAALAGLSPEEMSSVMASLNLNFH